MLEQRHGDVHDRGRPLHARVRLLRGFDGQTARARSGRTRARGRGDAADELKHVVITAVAREI